MQLTVHPAPTAKLAYLQSWHCPALCFLTRQVLHESVVVILTLPVTRLVLHGCLGNAQAFSNVDAAADIWNHVNPQFWE